MDHEPAQVLVVGAGPSGLVLALTLLQNGISVRIIDKEPYYKIGQRGAGIMPRSLELFNMLGVASEIEESGICPPPPCQLYELPGGTNILHKFEMAPYMEPTPNCPYLNILMLGQNRLEGILRKALAKYGCHVELATKLVAFEQNADFVSAEILQIRDGQSVLQNEKYKWLIGTDGAKGVVRKLLGLSFLGETRKFENIVIGDIRVSGLDRDHWHMWGDPTATMISLRPTEAKDDNVFNFLITGRDVNHAQVSSSRGDLLKFMDVATGMRDLEFGEIIWISHYTPNIRMIDTFGQGRVFIAGDAAHVHSPTGGQGMNTGIQDSFNLGWKLALVHKGLAEPALLSTYTEERLPVIAEMLHQTTALLDKTFETPPNDLDAVWQHDTSLYQLGVNYRWSSIVLDEETTTPTQETVIESYKCTRDGKVHAGDRAPDAPGLHSVVLPDNGEGRRLFELFGPSHHTVLIFASRSGESASVVRALQMYPKGTIRCAVILRHGTTYSCCEKLQGADFVLEDKEGYAYSTYVAGFVGNRIVIVRPDGVVGAIVREEDGLQHYFLNIFSSLASSH